MFPLSYAQLKSSFPLKTGVLKLNIFFHSRAKQIYRRALTVSEIRLKTKAISR